MKSQLSCLFLVVILGCARSAQAASPPAHSPQFDSANKMYEEGKYREAASAYGDILRSGRVSPALYFNLGNAWFKSRQLGRALAAYRQAERIDPRDPDLRANLAFARNQVRGPTLAPGWWQRWLGGLTVNEWSVLASAGLWVFLLSLTCGQIWPALKPALRVPVRLAGIATVALGACLGAALLADSARTAIVIADTAPVQTGPLDESQTAFTVHDGAELSVLDRKDDWLQVAVGDRRVGWIKHSQALLCPSEQGGKSEFPAN